MGEYLRRYRKGDHEAVWSELIAMGETAVQPPMLGEATAVAEELVRRLLINAQTVAKYLTDAGYEFASGPFIVAADESTAQSVQQIEQEFGRLPLVWKIWCSQVDHLNFYPSERLLKSEQGSHTEGISPAAEIVFDSPRDCIVGSREWAVLVRETWDTLLKIEKSTEGTADPNIPFLKLGPVTSGNDRVGFRLPALAVDSPCYSDRDDVPEDKRISRSIVDWLRYWYLDRGGQSWKYLKVKTTPEGEKYLHLFQRPDEEVRTIVRSMNLIPF